MRAKYNYPSNYNLQKAILTGIYPVSWKKGNIVPVHKKDNKNLVNNYRPISLLPICSKIFEKLIYNSLFQHLNFNDLLVKCQSGFLPGEFVNKLESIQYNAALAITGAIKGTSKERLYGELGFESLSKRRWYRRMCMFWKIVNNTAPLYLTKLLPNKQYSRNPSRQNLYYSFTRNTNYYANSFFPYCTDQGNVLDSKIKNIQSFSLFKKALLKTIRPSRAHVFDVSDISGLKRLTRLRLKLSHLNEHKFRHNFRDTLNPLCTCSLEPETLKHYLLHCPHYINPRKVLLDSIFAIDNSISNLSDECLVTILLYGNSSKYRIDENTSILNSTICFLKSSERFTAALFNHSLSLVDLILLLLLFFIN